MKKYRERDLLVKGNRIYQPTQLSLRKQVKYIEFVCYKNGFDMRRVSSPKRGTFTIEPNITDSYIYVPKAIRDAYSLESLNSVPVEDLENGDSFIGISCSKVPHAKMLTTPLSFAEEINKATLKNRKIETIYGRKCINVGGEVGEVRIDVYTKGARMIVIRTVNNIRDKDVLDYEYLNGAYGYGLVYLPKCDFSYRTKLIGTRGLAFPKVLLRMWDITEDTGFRLYKTNRGSVVIIPENPKCDICGEEIDLTHEVPEGFLFEEEVADEDGVLKEIRDEVKTMYTICIEQKNQNKDLLNELRKERKRRKALESIIDNLQENTSGRYEEDEPAWIPVMKPRTKKNALVGPDPVLLENERLKRQIEEMAAIAEHFTKIARDPLYKPNDCEDIDF